MWLHENCLTNSHCPICHVNVRDLLQRMRCVRSLEITLMFSLTDGSFANIGGITGLLPRFHASIPLKTFQTRTETSSLAPQLYVTTDFPHNHTRSRDNACLIISMLAKFRGKSTLKHRRPDLPKSPCDHRPRTSLGLQNYKYSAEVSWVAVATGEANGKHPQTDSEG